MQEKYQEELTSRTNGITSKFDDESKISANTTKTVNIAKSNKDDEDGILKAIIVLKDVAIKQE